MNPNDNASFNFTNKVTANPDQLNKRFIESTILDASFMT